MGPFHRRPLVLSVPLGSNWNLNPREIGTLTPVTSRANFNRIHLACLMYGEKNPLRHVWCVWENPFFFFPFFFIHFWPWVRGANCYPLVISNLGQNKGQKKLKIKVKLLFIKQIKHDCMVFFSIYSTCYRLLSKLVPSQHVELSNC